MFNIIIKTRVKSHILEKVIFGLMALFGISAVVIFLRSTMQGFLAQDVAMIEILLIVVLAILAQTIVLIKIYEQHT